MSLCARTRYRFKALSRSQSLFLSFPSLYAARPHSDSMVATGGCTGRVVPATPLASFRSVCSQIERKSKRISARPWLRSKAGLVEFCGYYRRCGARPHVVIHTVVRPIYLVERERESGTRASPLEKWNLCYNAQKIFQTLSRLRGKKTLKYIKRIDKQKSKFYTRTHTHAQIKANNDRMRIAIILSYLLRRVANEENYSYIS